MKAKILGVNSYKPEVKINSTDHKKFQRYLSEGFYVFYRKEGISVLRKKTEVMVTIEYEGKIKTINLTKELKQYYGEPRVSKLIEMFENDLKDDQVMLEVDSKGYYTIVKK